MQDEQKLKSTIDSIDLLLDPTSISKKDVWEINIIKILETMVRILGRTYNKDLKIAGIAVLSSSLIHRMKVESMFLLHKSTIKKKSIHKKNINNIQVIDMPYRHESTYPVTLDEMLIVLENLIGSISDTNKNNTALNNIEPVPNFNYIISLEKMLKKYESFILSKIKFTQRVLFKSITSELKPIDALRCFLSLLFLAKENKIELEQLDDNIVIKYIDDKNK